MTARWVPTGREFDEGAESPLDLPQPSRSRRLLDKVLGRNRGARPEMQMRPGVGEARSVDDSPTPKHAAPPSPPEFDGAAPITAQQQPLRAQIVLPLKETGASGASELVPAPPGAPRSTIPKKQAAVKAIRPAPNVSASEPTPTRRRRQTTVRSGVAPEIETPQRDTRNGRIGTCQQGLDEAGLRRQIGSTQNYRDD